MITPQTCSHPIYAKMLNVVLTSTLIIISFCLRYHIEGNFAGENFGKINFGEFKPSFYSYFRCYKQLAGKSLVNL